MASDASAVQKGRLYTIQHQENYLDCGICADGRQALRGLSDAGLTSIFFDSAGELLGCEVRPFPDEARGRSPAADAALERAWETWADEIGYQPATIHVRKFVVAEQGIGIEDRPDHMVAFLKAPELEEPDAENREFMFDDIREWDESGKYVLYYGNDLWMDADGSVNSS